MKGITMKCKLLNKVFILLFSQQNYVEAHERINNEAAITFLYAGSLRGSKMFGREIGSGEL